jgi:hypothetical protein
MAGPEEKSMEKLDALDFKWVPLSELDRCNGNESPFQTSLPSVGSFLKGSFGMKFVPTPIDPGPQGENEAGSTKNE